MVLKQKGVSGLLGVGIIAVSLLIIGGIVFGWHYGLFEQIHKESDNIESTEQAEQKGTNQNSKPSEFLQSPNLTELLSSNAELLKKVEVDFEGDGQKEVVFVEQIANWKVHSKKPDSSIKLSAARLAAGGVPYTTNVVLLQYKKAAKIWERSMLDKILGSRLVGITLLVTDLNQDNREEVLFSAKSEGTAQYLLWGLYAKAGNKIKRVEILNSSLSKEAKEWLETPGMMDMGSLHLVDNFLVPAAPLYVKGAKPKNKPFWLEGLYFKFDGENLVFVTTTQCVINELVTGKGCLQWGSPLAKTSLLTHLSLKNYRNTSLGIEFDYPSRLGKVVDQGERGYIIKTLGFTNTLEDRSCPTTSKSVLKISIFTDSSLKQWQDHIQESLGKGEPIGDAAWPSYSLSVRKLLKTKPVGYDCTSDFASWLNRERNESCEIVEKNSQKAFRIVATGPLNSGGSRIKYIFVSGEKWVEITAHFYYFVYEDKNQSSVLLYTRDQLNKVLSQGGDILTYERIKDLEEIANSFKFIQ